MTYRVSYHRRTDTISNETLLNKKETYKWKFIALSVLLSTCRTMAECPPRFVCPLGGHNLEQIDTIWSHYIIMYLWWLLHCQVHGNIYCSDQWLPRWYPWQTFPTPVPSFDSSRNCHYCGHSSSTCAVSSSISSKTYLISHCLFGHANFVSSDASDLAMGSTYKLAWYMASLEAYSATSRRPPPARSLLPCKGQCLRVQYIVGGGLSAAEPGPCQSQAWKLRLFCCSTVSIVTTHYAELVPIKTFEHEKKYCSDKTWDCSGLHCTHSIPTCISKLIVDGETILVGIHSI